MIKLNKKLILIPLVIFGSLAACSDIQEGKNNKAVTEEDTTLKHKNLHVLAPVAKKVDHILSIHGDDRNDKYYWLRDDTRKSEEVLNYLNAENEYTQTKLAHTKDLQKTLFNEITSRLEPNEESVPVFNKGYWSWSKFEAGKDYRIHIRQKGSLDAPEEVVLDQNIRANGHDYYALGGLVISPDQKMVALAEDTISRRNYEVRVMNLADKTLSNEVIKNTSGTLVWANDNKTLFYVKKHPTTLLPYQVYRHVLGTSPETDVLVYEELDDTFYTHIYKTRSQEHIAIHLGSTMSSEIRLIDANNPTNAPKTFLAREKNHNYRVDHINGYFYVQSDLNALNEQVFQVKENLIGDKVHWKKLISHRTDTLIQNFELFDNYFLVNERSNGLEKLRLYNYSGDLIKNINFTDAAYTASIANNPDPSATVVRFNYSSMTTPNTLFEYNTLDEESKVLKQDKVIGDFTPDNYQSERIMITARDGKKVPVSLVYRKSLFKKGTNPVLHYAYGSYGSTVTPRFRSSRLSLLDRGFVFAISHVRGSKMLGRPWYEDGKKLTKINTFTDFNDATKALVKLGYAAKNKVYAEGGSAGGLLMGAIINMEPKLYHGVIAQVPFVDVVTTMLDASIPLTTGEYDEWGNPEDKVYYDYMLSYSPNEKVKAQDYPNLLVTTGLHDSQVQYWEPAKWVAKLRDMNTDDNML
jgi:oligopeptidase B